MTPNTLTPHITCSPEDFAKTVLMPGDPLRAKRIVERYLTDYELVNNTRGVQGYTGYFNGKRVSVMASGMGMPSMGIYSYELFNVFGVENIIRIGSAGAIHPDLKLFDLVIGQGACTDSNYFKSFGIEGNFAPIASFKLLEKANAVCREHNIRYKVGNLLSSDVFYSTTALDWRKVGVLAVEMEAASLYMNAAAAGKNALAICTISDIVESHEITTTEQRQDSFLQMVEVALEVAE